MRHVFVFGLLLVVSFANRVFLETAEHKSVPEGYTLIDEHPDPNTILSLTFVLKIRNAQRLEQLFWSVSDPDSPNYAKYVDLSYIADNYGPDFDVLDKLYGYLNSFGVNSFKVVPTRDFLTVDVSLKTAETIFEVTFSRFHHTEYGSIIRTLKPYSLPEEIAQHVSFVTGMNRFLPKRPLKVQTSKRYTAQQTINPQVIWSTFATNGITGKATNNLQSVAQFLQQYFDPQDLADFQSNFNIPNQPADKIIGPNDPTNPGTEALLDIEYIIGTAPHIPTWFWSTGGLNDGQEPFVLWAQNVNAATTVPIVMSVSYGDEESSVSKVYTDRLNEELQKLGIRGVSVLFASGDNGVGCISSCVQDPNWPASSPYVTAVGGFYLDSNLVGDSISSGGFSNYYAAPSYQTAAVGNYLANGPNLPPSNTYNKTSRAMPDVSSFSENVAVFQSGSEYGVGGTSCASPVFAGVISLINDQLLQANKSSLGFLNTALYKIGASTPSAFIDITTGANDNGCCQGFTATKGWDPITGWGGPNYPVLLKAFQAFQGIFN